MIYSPAEYIRWVKASLNHHIGSRLPDNGADTGDYRLAVKSFQTRHGIQPANGEVDKKTQDKLIWLNHADQKYVFWASHQLGAYLARRPSRYWSSDLNQVVRLCEFTMGVPIDEGWIGPQVEHALRSWKLPSPNPKRPGLISA